MTLRPYYSRMPQLLRIAPYIDFEDFRKEMTEYAAVALAAYDATVSNGRRLKISEFISGQGHTLPDAYNFTSRMNEYLWNVKAMHEPEPMYDDASGAFYYYFFVPDRGL